MEDVKRFLLVLVWRGSGEKGILQALGLIQTYCGRVQNETGLQFLKTGHETGLKRHLLESEIGKRYLLVCRVERKRRERVPPGFGSDTDILRTGSKRTGRCALSVLEPKPGGSHLINFN